MDDKSKISLIVFNVVFLLYQIVFNWGDAFTWTKLFLAFVVGGVAAAVTFGIMAAMKK
jgi:hypothetical protein